MPKPTIPQGTRDFGPETVRKRNYILQLIKGTFETYGFQPLETPAMENLETLMGKYGDEGDKLIFKILNNGLERVEKHEQAKTAFASVLEGKSSKLLTERALRYDLTIPFARYVAMNHSQLTMPYKRYQIQPVWRADRPQRGRYREFYQCDADVVGSTSLWNEVDLANIYHTVFTKLKLVDYVLHINSRKILTALATKCGGLEKLADITTAIDKLDKVGIEKVQEELVQRGLVSEQVKMIEEYLLITGTNSEKMEQVQHLLGDIEIGKKGIDEIQFMLNHFGSSNQNEGSNQTSVNLQVDFTLARGLDYYTGIIFEVKAPPTVKIGSIGGGGRYDDLTGLFDVPGIPGVGISFGVDRIYDVLEELQLFPEELNIGTKVLFFNLGVEESKVAYRYMQQLRELGIPSELYHESAKFDKQFKYAERKKIAYAAIIGAKELGEGNIVIKDLRKGQQVTVSVDNLRNVLFI